MIPSENESVKSRRSRAAVGVRRCQGSYTAPLSAPLTCTSLHTTLVASTIFSKSDHLHINGLNFMQRGSSGLILDIRHDSTPNLLDRAHKRSARHLQLSSRPPHHSLSSPLRSDRQANRRLILSSFYRNIKSCLHLQHKRLLRHPPSPHGASTETSLRSRRSRHNQRRGTGSLKHKQCSAKWTNKHQPRCGGEEECARACFDCCYGEAGRSG